MNLGDWISTIGAASGDRGPSGSRVARRELDHLEESRTDHGWAPPNALDRGAHGVQARQVGRLYRPRIPGDQPLTTRSL